MCQSVKRNFDSLIYVYVFVLCRYIWKLVNLEPARQTWFTREICKMAWLIFQFCFCPNRGDVNGFAALWIQILWFLHLFKAVAKVGDIFISQVRQVWNKVFIFRLVFWVIKVSLHIFRCRTTWKVFGLCRKRCSGNISAQRLYHLKFTRKLGEKSIRVVDLAPAYTHKRKQFEDCKHRLIYNECDCHILLLVMTEEVHKCDCHSCLVVIFVLQNRVVRVTCYLYHPTSIVWYVVLPLIGD